MAKSKITVQEVNAKVEDIASKFSSGLLDLKQQLETKFSSLPTSPCAEAEKVDLLFKIQTFENFMRQAIDALKSDVAVLNSNVMSVKQSVSNLSENINKHCIIVYGLEETGRNLYDVIVKFLNEGIIEKLPISDGLAVTKNHINLCYRTGKKTTDKARPTVIRFVNIWLRDLIYQNKKLLKGSRIIIVEKLNPENLAIFNEVRRVNKSAWTFRGVTYVLRDGRKTPIKSSADIAVVLKTSDADPSTSSDRAVSSMMNQ